MNNIQQIGGKDLYKIQLVESVFDGDNFASHGGSKMSDEHTFKLEMFDDSLSGIGINKGDLVHWTTDFDFGKDMFDQSGGRFLYVLSLATGDLVPRMLEYGGINFSTVYWCDKEQYYEMQLISGEFDIVGKVTGIEG